MRLFIREGVWSEVWEIGMLCRVNTISTLLNHRNALI